ncbi:MAG: hypothetical protein MK312_13520, partial [Roseibacillus sp.]|nr:hypothetical protein [Roseibacillus sp.]
MPLVARKDYNSFEDTVIWLREDVRDEIHDLARLKRFTDIAGIGVALRIPARRVDGPRADGCALN